jgi:hypothetical protein
LAVLLVILLIAQVFLARLNNRKISHEVRHYLFYTVVGTFSLGCLIILSLGGTILLTTTLQRYLLPSIGSQQLVYLIALEVVKFAFNLISVAAWISLGMIFVYLTLIFFEKSTLVINAREKNQKYKQRSAIIGSDNRTLDGQFHSILDENPGLMNKSAVATETNIDTIDKTAFNGPMNFSEPETFNVIPANSGDMYSSNTAQSPLPQNNQTSQNFAPQVNQSATPPPETNQNTQAPLPQVNPKPQNPINSAPNTTNIRGL